MTNVNKMSVIDKLLDEENCDNIVLFDEDDNEIEFEQIAIIPLNDETYAILHPVKLLEGLSEDEALVYLIDEDADTIAIVEDENIIDEVFNEYYKLIREENN